MFYSTDDNKTYAVDPKTIFPKVNPLSLLWYLSNSVYADNVSSSDGVHYNSIDDCNFQLWSTDDAGWTEKMYPRLVGFINHDFISTSTIISFTVNTTIYRMRSPDINTMYQVYLSDNTDWDTSGIQLNGQFSLANGTYNISFPESYIGRTDLIYFKIMFGIGFYDAVSYGCMLDSNIQISIN